MTPFESLNDALIEAVKALGGSKQVGHQLWPEKTVDAAQRHLLACLNEDKPERLSPDHLLMLLRLARAKGYHGAMDCLCAQLSYAVSPIEPKDEIAELQRQFIETQARMADMLGRMERLQGVQHFPTLRSAA